MTASSGDQFSEQPLKTRLRSKPILALSAEQVACCKRRVLRNLGTKQKPLLPPLGRLHTAAALVICVSGLLLQSSAPVTQALEECSHLTVVVLPLEQSKSEGKVGAHLRQCKGCLVACDLTQPSRVSSRVRRLALFIRAWATH